MKGPAPTGHVLWMRDDAGVFRWHMRPRIPGHGRPYIALPREILEGDEATAKTVAVAMTSALRAQATPGSILAETVAAYAERWTRARKVNEATRDLARLKNHVLNTRLGALPVATVTRADVEDVVLHLDSKIEGGELAWKSSQNVWGVVTKLFDDAKNHKDRTLRVRDDNPTHEVRGPEIGVRRAKVYLYPSEFDRLVRCDDVPARTRTLYAVAVMTYARAGELAALTVGDVDLEHATLHVTKAVERVSKRVKSTKSGESRRIPIEAALLPLMARLCGGRRASDRLLWLPPAEDRAELLRRHLQLAGVARPTLFENTEATRHVTFHDLRATGQTWAAVRGDDHLKIMRRAGHADAETSMIYIREAENLRGDFGTPFSPLPEALLGTGLALA